jgi:NAD(P)H-flavin reductase
MIQTYKTTLSEKKQLTSDVFLYKFKLIEPVTLSFIPGQYLILLVPKENGENARRLYSIASPNTTTGEFELLVKLIPNGCASMYFKKIQVNDECEFQGPAGMFTLRENQRDKIFMVTGTGYAPVRSILKSISNNQSPITNNYYLFIGFPYCKDVFLLDELKLLTSNFKHLTFYICLSREQNLEMISEEDRKYFMLGRVTTGLEKLIENFKLKTENFDYYLCGSREVIESLKQYLSEKAAPKEQVYFEKF